MTSEVEGCAGVRTGVRSGREVMKITWKSRGGSHLGAAQALSCRVVGLGGHVDVIIVTMTITVTKLYHPFGAAPLLGLQTVLRVPARLG